MKTLYVALNSVEKVKEFVNIMNSIEGEVDLSDGRYVVNAKSIMGIFSLDLAKKLSIEIKNWKEEYGGSIENFLCE